MIKLLIGSLLVVTTTAFAQTTPRQEAKRETKPTSRSIASTITENPAKKGTDASPLPQTTKKQKLQSRNSAIPTYRMEKAQGKHRVDNRYEPRRTDSGARKDTLKQKRSN